MGNRDEILPQPANPLLTAMSPQSQARMTRYKRLMGNIRANASDASFFAWTCRLRGSFYSSRVWTLDFPATRRRPIRHKGHWRDVTTPSGVEHPAIYGKPLS